MRNVFSINPNKFIKNVFYLRTGTVGESFGLAFNVPLIDGGFTLVCGLTADCCEVLVISLPLFIEQVFSNTGLT